MELGESFKEVKSYIEKARKEIELYIGRELAL
jgi:hypothetical protein